MTIDNDSRVIVALDYKNTDDALAFVDRIEPGSCKLKIGKELFTRGGPQVVRECHGRGFEIFLDLKFLNEFFLDVCKTMLFDEFCNFSIKILTCNLSLDYRHKMFPLCAQY